jgi:uncharacterized membrane protein
MAIHIVEIVCCVMLVALVVIALVLIIRGAGRTPAAGRYAPVSAAIAELDLRYARGEIDHDDYVTRRANLLGLRPAAPAEPPTEKP